MKTAYSSVLLREPELPELLTVARLFLGDSDFDPRCVRQNNDLSGFVAHCTAASNTCRESCSQSAAELVSRKKTHWWLEVEEKTALIYVSHVRAQEVL